MPKKKLRNITELNAFEQKIYMEVLQCVAESLSFANLYAIGRDASPITVNRIIDLMNK
jgi:diadenosine tetraphosphate (Ap4A) HIT family hydrolase